MTDIKHIQHVIRDTQGATAVEYSLLAALIMLAIMTAVQGVASETNTMWTHINTTMANATASS